MTDDIMTVEETVVNGAQSDINTKADVLSSNVKSDSERIESLRNKDGKLPTLTDEQKQAVLSKGHILVSAAAGSGKTYTMVKRIMLMVAEGVSMRDMLVLVYNTAAAEELKNKLHTELFEMACSARGEERERFRRELDDLPFCHICTIHSFCNALIRDNFDKLGISPSFEVLDEKQHATYMNTALDNVFELYALEGDDAFDDIVEIFSQARREDNLRANVIKLHTLIDIQPDKQGFYDKVKACYAGFEDSEFMRVLRDYYAAYFKEAKCKLAVNELELSKTSLEKFKTAIRIAFALCDEMCSADSFRKMCAIAAEYEKPEYSRRGKMDDNEKFVSLISKDYLDDVFKVCEELKGLLSEFDKMQTAHAQNAVYIDKIIELTARFDEELTKLKQDDNVLSFEDLQHFTVKLLTDYPELGSQYSAVFVDEYQDVNPTQEFIINSLVRDECFMVGDVKQSIYGFRLADPKIFLSRQKSYKDGDGIAIDFNRNFRSARAILEFVNAVFDVVMTEESADVDYKNTSAFVLDGMPDDSIELDGEKVKGFVQVHLFTNKRADSKTASGLYDITRHEQEDESVSGAEFEGAYIAKQIKQLVRGGAITDGRRISYGDIAVLFRSRSTNASKIVGQLKLAGIPVDEGIFEKSASSPERELVAMLRMIDNPRQDIPLAGFLLSFFGGYNESELAEIAAEDGECLYDKAILFIAKNTNNALAGRLKDTFAVIDNYRLKASFKSVSDLMGGIVSDFCYDAYLMKAGEADVCGLKAFI
ncbi:MAG: UvrD-helicase domain-containing protein, partial [Clostridia bacterium]|nr:UvrD-helicase domain-containing protein [Clostridia bacterium]